MGDVGSGWAVVAVAAAVKGAAVFKIAIGSGSYGAVTRVIDGLTTRLPEDHPVRCAPDVPRQGDHCLVSEGWFWSACDEARVRGEFTAEIGLDAEVTLAGAVADDPRLMVEHTATGPAVTSVSGDPAEYVAAFAPMDLHGQLDSGELVSLLSAQNHGLFAPHYVARVAVFGAHVSGDQLYSAVRFRIDDPYWTAHLADGENQTVPDDGSVLRAVAPEEGPDKGMWLVYESAQPRSLRDLDSRVVVGCRALAGLALDRPLAVGTIEIRISQDGEWLPLHSKARTAPVSGYGESLLPREELTVERFANWIALNDRLDGLASSVHELGKGTVQLQVLVGTSLVEGLHRRLPYAQSQFPTASRSACDRIKKAARKAAAERATDEEGIDPDLVHTAVKDAVGHFEDVGYRARAQDITDEVTSVVPELVESVPDLAGKLTAARNDIAHHLVLNDETEPFAERIDRWVVISYVTPWLLRLLLLVHAGIESDALHRACLGSQRFGFVRANVAAITRDLGWLPAAELCVLSCVITNRSEFGDSRRASVNRRAGSASCHAWTWLSTAVTALRSSVEFPWPTRPRWLDRQGRPGPSGSRGLSGCTCSAGRGAGGTGCQAGRG